MEITDQEYNKLQAIIKNLNKIPAEEWKRYNRNGMGDNKGFYTIINDRYVLIEKWFNWGSCSDDLSHDAQISILENYEDIDNFKESYEFHITKEISDKYNLYDKISNLADKINEGLIKINDKKCKKRRESEIKAEKEKRIGALEKIL